MGPESDARSSEQHAARKTAGMAGAGAVTFAAVPFLLWGAAYAGMGFQPSPEHEDLYGSALGVAMGLVGLGLLCCASGILVRHSVGGLAWAIVLPLIAGAAWLAFTWWMIFSDVIDLFLHIPAFYYFALTGFAIPIAPALAIAYGVLKSRSRASRLMPQETTEIGVEPVTG